MVMIMFTWQVFVFPPIFLEDICPFCVATSTLVLDFWWQLTTASGSGWIPSPACFVACAKWIPQFHLWVQYLLSFDDRHGNLSPLPTYFTARQRSCGNVIFSVIWPLQTYSKLFTCKSPTHTGTPFPPPQLQSRPPPAPALVLVLAPSSDMFKLVYFGRWAVGFD